jgi:hypothetical protein
MSSNREGDWLAANSRSLLGKAGAGKHRQPWRVLGLYHVALFANALAIGPAGNNWRMRKHFNRELTAFREFNPNLCVFQL